MPEASLGVSKGQPFFCCNIVTGSLSDESSLNISFLHGCEDRVLDGPTSGEKGSKGARALIFRKESCQKSITMDRELEHREGLAS